MSNLTRYARYKPLAILFIVSLAISIGLGLVGPRLIPHPSGMITKPEWMLWTSLVFGLVAVATVPVAWRWLYLRRN
ncbi:MAG: hypothetical protein QM719_02775 [Thermomonas sp.]